MTATEDRWCAPLRLQARCTSIGVWLPRAVVIGGNRGSGTCKLGAEVTFRGSQGVLHLADFSANRLGAAPHPRSCKNLGCKTFACRQTRTAPLGGEKWRVT